MHEIAKYLADVALFWPGLVVTAIVSAGAAAPLARRTGSSPAVAALLVFGIGLIVSATLTPSREAIRFGAVGSGVCDLSRFGPPSLAELLRFDDPAFNVALFVPLGLAVALLPGGRLRWLLLIAGFVLPPLIELTQLAVVQLGRACQSGDASDNILGFVVGLGLGALVTLFWRRPPSPGDR